MRVAQCAYHFNRGICVHANSIRVIQLQSSLDLPQRDSLLTSNNVDIEILKVSGVFEKECLGRVEIKGENVLDVIESDLGKLIHGVIWVIDTEEEVLIVSDLNEHWHIEHVLQVFAEKERNSVTNMECVP